MIELTLRDDMKRNAERIAAREQCNNDLHADVQRFREHAMNERDARMALDRKSNQDDETIQFQAAEIAKHLDRIAALDLQVLSALAQADDNWQRVKELERELAEASKDAERYRFLKTRRSKRVWNHVLDPQETENADTLDAAIDAALTPPEQPK